MGERDLLAEGFEEHRSHLRAVAYRMLGSLDGHVHALVSASKLPNELVARGSPPRPRNAQSRPAI